MDRLILKLFPFIILLFTDVLGNTINHPRILGDKEIILKGGTSHVLECIGEEPMKWLFPKVPEIASNYGTSFSISNKMFMRNGTYLYHTYLNVDGITYPWTGYYTCKACKTLFDLHGREMDLGMAKVYIYVDDGNHLSASTSRAILIDYNSSGVILPCRPTTPNVKVTVTSIDIDGTPTNQLFFAANFSSKLGFTLIPHGWYYFKCRFQKGNSIQDDTIILGRRIPEKMSFVQNQKSIYRLDDGSMRLTMDISRIAYFDHVIYWLTPNNDGILNYYPYSKYYKNIAIQDTFGINDLSIWQSIKMFAWKKLNHITGGLDFRKYFLKERIFEEDNGTYVSFRESKGPPIYTTIDVKIFDTIEEYLVLKPRIVACEIHQESNGFRTTELIVDIFTTLSSFSVSWSFNGNRINPNRKYNIMTNASQTTLRIFNSIVTDSGVYTVNVFKRSLNRYADIKVYIVSAPQAAIEVLHSVDGPLTAFQCSANGNPMPEIRWCFYPKSISYSSDHSGYSICKPPPEPFNQYVSTKNGTVRSIIRFMLEMSGTLLCKAWNYVGEDTHHINITHSDNKVSICITSGTNERKWNVSLDKDAKILRSIEDSLKLVCTVSTDLKVANITWLFNKNDVSGETQYIFNIPSNSPNIQYQLTKEVLQLNDTGYYTCLVRFMNGMQVNRTIQVIVDDPYTNTWKHFVPTNSTYMELPVNLGETVYLNCTTCDPFPIQWSKDGKLLKNFDENRIILKAGKTLRILSISDKDTGNYTCSTGNGFANVKKTFGIVISDSPQNSLYIWIGGTLIFILILTIVVTRVFPKFFKITSQLEHPESKCILRDAQIKVPFEEPKTTQNLLTDFLPYDRKWNFPLKNIRFSSEVKSEEDCFLVEGEAMELVNDTECTKVTIKLIDHRRRIVQKEFHMKRLLNELKISIHLGHHINIENILGACTEHIQHYKLFLIKEYCPFGDTLSFLQKNNRSKFVDLINSDVDKIDMNLLLLGTNFQAIQNSTTEDTHTAGNDTNNADYQFNTKNLIEWSYQIAMGMKYLAQKYVVHGDLRATNILLYHRNVVKISNFTQSKILFNRTTCLIENKNVEQLKWMAIETLQHNIISFKSDVWSFGVVMWEFFTLGSVPYPNTSMDAEFVHKLKQGYRLNRPEFAESFIYEMMKNCWTECLQARPTFCEICKRLYRFLNEIENSTVHGDQYMEVNEKYIGAD